MNKDDILDTLIDLKGRITYANDAFVAISGFNREELIGSSHTLFGLQTCPEASFEDLWATLKRNNPWTALVRNLTILRAVKIADFKSC